jgi:hypothetical protein
VYPHVGVDASGLATLRATVATVQNLLRGLVPTAHAVPAFATATPAGPCYALAESGAAVGRRGRSAGATTARRPAADSDSARMMDLVERAQAGEAEAFGRLYDQYSDTVYRYIYYRVGGKATAEDLTSETFLRALSAAEGLDLSRCAAYSDSHNDIPMLSLVGHPYAINPDAKLRRHAREKDWRLRDYRTGRKAAKVGIPAAAGVGAVAGGTAAAIALSRRRR